MKHLTRLPLLLAITLGVALPAVAAPPRPAPARKPAATAKSKPGKKPAQRKQRLAQARKLLTQASAASKNAAVKKGVTATLALLDKKQFRPAYVKVSELKRTAALANDNRTVVMGLLNAEEVIGKIADREAKGKTR